ncbi:PilN domain-containing protein [Fervidibacillus halotolerans]|uniref:PilN domain-containing protein n=1 Tax=Fervidibacillus halotolerans TaxID=2980027 RepID=A0A9E8RZ58_9BACI|nr:PilN domain-containing protein [Fervidibacillus halotolerans]WAA12839.1 PilN domain-containing protein [Fervidibacillus halotolerans]
MIPDINLLPERDRKADAFGRVFYLLIGIWVILLIVFGYQFFQTKSDRETLQKEIDSLTLDKRILETKGNEQPTDDANRFQEAVEYVDNLPLPTSKIITELLHLLPNEHSYLTHYSYTGGNVSIETAFETLDSVATYVSKLTNSDMFQNVKVDHISTTSIETDQTETYFDVLPRYNVLITIEVYLSSLRPAGGDIDE